MCPHKNLWAFNIYLKFQLKQFNTTSRQRAKELLLIYDIPSMYKQNFGKTTNQVKFLKGIIHATE